MSLKYEPWYQVFSTGAKRLETLPFRAIDYVVRSALTPHPHPIFDYQTLFSSPGDIY